MSMTIEWRRRVDRWKAAMPELFYLPLGTIEFEGFATRDQLEAAGASARRFHPMPEGTPWGAKWEYGWFRGSLKLPASAAGERIAARIDVGGEAAIMVNGADHGANDIGHKEITLVRKAKGGERFDILLESYAGHGPRECGGGPAIRDKETVPEPPARQVRVGRSTWGIWEEELFQLWLDTETLVQLRDAMLDTESLRVAEIDDALKEMTLAVDLEAPRAEMLASARRGRAVLKPLLARRNGDTAPLMSCFGHSHIDVAWLWPLAETERKCARTFASQLALMEEYPEYRFLQSQPHLYGMVRQRYPSLYARVKEAAAGGQWMAEGGMWVEADTNVTGGESLIRQFIHGKRFYKEELGVDSELMWLPDVFGYSGALPQIMKGCGISYFSTQKIFWTYNGGDPFPYNLFWWEGIDGTAVLSYLHNDYNSLTTPAAVAQRWNERVQKDSTHTGRLMPFGHGDGGGGPTREHLEFLRRQRNLEGQPRCEISDPVRFFRSIEPATRAKLPHWVGELYFQAHRGTYTSQARTKRGNRLAEIALREAELWGAVAAALGRKPYPLAAADGLWKALLLNQFHDIIPGSSIHRVYEEAEASHAAVIAAASGIAAAARSSLIAKSASHVTVFNSLSWPRTAVVRLPAGMRGLETSRGEPLPLQAQGKDVYALVGPIPPCGWVSFREGKPAKPAASPVAATGRTLENELVKLTFDGTGAIRSIRDKATGEEIAAGPCNELRVFKDVPNWFDAWDIDSMYKLQRVDTEGKAEIAAVASGPLFAALRVKRQILDSQIDQEIVLRAGSRRVEFRTRIEWRERHKLLKVGFPVTVRAEDALHEVQFGHVRRPTHATRPYDAARFEVCNHKWTALVEEARGAAVLNDCKYGVSVEGSDIALTLLKSALAPDMKADQGAHELTYAFTFWNGPWKDSGVVQEAYELNVPVTTAKGRTQTESLLSVDAPNVVIETVKPAEDGSGDLVVRLYESARTATSCRLRFGLPVKEILLTDMLERRQGTVKPREQSVALRFRPFEIKTVRLRL
jgi:alpha-mannosidase